jgi:hypothetical protein
MEKRKVKHTAVFYPCTMGVFLLLIIILSFTAGAIRREPVLTLTGAVIFAVWAYCLVMTLLSALFLRRRAKNISIRLEPERIVCGGWTNAAYTGKNIFQLPGILVRCRVLLSTRDRRRVTYDFKPENKTGLQQNTFQVKKRGAYFSAYDEFAVFDILGFFRFAYRIPSAAIASNSGAVSEAFSGAVSEDTGGARLLAGPNTAAELISVRAKGGETNRQDALTLERTDYLIDHRPYVPGDDPRRINWKLYSHGGELIVRQGEREPPPSSNLTILIDTQYDSLYSADSEATEAVDLLCESALAIINNAGNETNIQIGITGYSTQSGNSLTPAELGFFLAYPAALSAAAQLAVKIPAVLPPVTEDRGVIILALPRVDTSPSALEKFLAANANRSIELLFIYAARGSDCEKYAAAAETCTGIYNRRPGVRARAAGVL